ncbi:MAG: Kelch domain protein [Solirubrobacterales bacterium]|nr:Kelch domain protein [Solirubrobacterales bacterium]
MEVRRSTRPRARGASRHLRVALLPAMVLTLLATGAGAASAAVSSPYFDASGVGETVDAREGSVAAPLPNGDVLIAGGAGQKTAEVFNPATDSFNPTGETPQDVRAGAAAAPLPNGDVLIVGGSGGEKTAELYDPATGAFTAVTEKLRIARTGAVAARLPDGDVLIAGGSTETAAELYEPTAGTFTATSQSMLSARSGAAAAALPNGEVLIAGGGTLATAELFNPSTEKFSLASGSEHMARETAVAALLPNGQVLISGGANASQEKSAELFNPGTGTFAELPTPPSSPRASAVATPLPNGQVLIVGGSGSAAKTAELFFSAPQAAVAGGTFGDQTVAEPSAVSVLVITNIGAQSLSLATVSPPSSGEFAITAETCAGRALAFEQSCTISVRFTPVATGPREAKITILDNEPNGSSTIALTGTGMAADAGPTGTNGSSGAAGAQGATGPTGATGATGARGPAGQDGQVILVTCTTTTKTVNHKPKKVTKCTSRSVPTPTTFTSTSIERAWLDRRGLVYASGTAEKGRVVLHARRALVAGRYMLTLVRGRGRHAVVRRTAVELP